MAIKTTEGQTIRLALTGKEERALLKELTGQDMAADLQEITLRARDLLPAMKERLSAVKAQAAQNGKALTGKSNVKVASESTIKIKNHDGTINYLMDQTLLEQKYTESFVITRRIIRITSTTPSKLLFVV